MRDFFNMDCLEGMKNYPDKYFDLAILTPTKAIRKKCLSCDENAAEVKRCSITECPLYEMRMGKRPKGSRPLKAIRKECLDCMGGSSNLVKECHLTKCPLHPYRSGHRPKGE